MSLAFFCVVENKEMETQTETIQVETEARTNDGGREGERDEEDNCDGSSDNHGQQVAAAVRAGRRYQYKHPIHRSSIAHPCRNARITHGNNISQPYANPRLYWK